MKLTAQFTADKKLIPCYDSDYQQAMKIKPGVDYLIEIKQPRNLGNHRRFFALLNLVLSNQSTYSNINHLRHVMTLKAGYFDTVITDKGAVYIPHSISFASMDELKFKEYFSKFIDVACDMLYLNNDDLLNELQNFF